MDEIEWWEFDTAAEMAAQVAGDVEFVISSAIEAHGGARLGLPGGSTPLPIYKALLARKIDWAKVTLLPTDERLVSPEHAASNFGALRKTFVAKGATVLPLIDESALEDYRAAGRAADARLAELQWPLDLVWLGVGVDGHTASIYPGPDLDSAVAGPRARRAVGVRPDPMPADAPHDRVTLTASALLSARALMIVIAGADKRAVLEAAIADGPLSTKPIGRVIAGLDAPIDIYWSAE